MIRNRKYALAFAATLLFLVLVIDESFLSFRGSSFINSRYHAVDEKEAKRAEVDLFYDDAKENEKIEQRKIPQQDAEKRIPTSSPSRAIPPSSSPTIPETKPKQEEPVQDKERVDEANKDRNKENGIDKDFKKVDDESGNDSNKNEKEKKNIRGDGNRGKFWKNAFVVNPNLTVSKMEKCFKNHVPAPRTTLDCETHLSEKSIYPDFLNSPKRKKNHSQYFGRNVTVLEDTDWGFTCNKMEIMGGAIYRMLTNKKFAEAETNMLAVGPLFSGLVWQLDLKFLTRDFPILVDCVECQDPEDKVDPLIRCGSLIVDGEVIDIREDGVFPISNKYWASEMYWMAGPSVLGFHPAMAYYMLPREHIRRSVEKVMLNRDKKTLGIHRRDMENWCYRYIGGGPTEYECHINNEALPIINNLLKAKTPEKFEKGFYFKPLEEKFPWIAICNYTLDEEQLEIFGKEWPEVFIKGKKLHVLFTTDSNDVSGDKILMKSPAIDTFFRMSDASTDVGCMKDKHRMLFYDMYGLALSDYHMANPLSSCDVTVVHWRRILNKDRESSYPQPCYHGYFDQEIDFI